MKHYLLVWLTLSVLLGWCATQTSSIKIQEVVYQSQTLASPTFIFTGNIFSGTQNIKILRENSGTKKEYFLSYVPNQLNFSEDFRIDKGNIAYGTNNYTLSFLDNTSNVIAQWKLQLNTYYQSINLGHITLYFDEKWVNSCWGGCRIHSFWEGDNNNDIIKNKDVQSKNGIDETINFALWEVMPYEKTPILYKDGEKFIVTTWYIFYNRKLWQFFEARNIHDMSWDRRLFLWDLYINWNFIIKDFPVEYRNTWWGRIVPIVYEPEKDLISVKWQDGDWCGYTKGEAKYKISNWEVILYQEINSSDWITFQINNKNFKIIKMLSWDILSLKSNDSTKEETLINNEKIDYRNTSSNWPCQTDLTWEINQKKQEIIVKKMPIVWWKGQSFVRKFDNMGNITRVY